LTIAGLLAGCASLDRESELEVGLVDLRLRSSTVLETTLDVALRIENPTPDPVKLRGATHKLVVNDVKLGKAMAGESLEIPRFGSTVQWATVHLSHLRLATKLPRLLESEAIDYRLESLLYFQGGGRARVRREDRLHLGNSPPENLPLAPSAGMQP